MRIAAVLLCAAALAACGGRDPVAEEAENATALPDPVNQAGHSPTGGPPADNAAGRGAEPPAAGVIPVALHGRWGLSPADCISTVGDAKGLLVVGPNELRFYESVAVPGEHVVTSADSVGGDFDFTGEGQSWTKYQSVRLRDRKLVRTERNPVASFRYVRCD